MAVYAIGDVQGCYDTLHALLKKIAFNPERDRVWLVGDLVNRGPKSLEVLRWAANGGASVQAVLGNHDLHLLRRVLGVGQRKRRDTLDQILAAPDRDALVAWLRARPFLAQDAGHIIVHGGFAPQWSLAQAEELARELEASVRGPKAGPLLERHVLPSRVVWDDSWKGIDRLAVALRIMTNIRVVDRAGAVDFDYSGPPAEAPDGLVPWFKYKGRKTESEKATVVFGHWSALGLHREKGFAALDTGCVWGNALTALCLDDGKVFQVAALEPPTA